MGGRIYRWRCALRTQRPGNGERRAEKEKEHRVRPSQGRGGEVGYGRDAYVRLRRASGWALSVAHLSHLVFHLFDPKRQRIQKIIPFST